MMILQASGLRTTHVLTLDICTTGGFTTDKLWFNCGSGSSQTSSVFPVVLDVSNYGGHSEI